MFNNDCKYNEFVYDVKACLDGCDWKNVRCDLYLVFDDYKLDFLKKFYDTLPTLSDSNSYDNVVAELIKKFKFEDRWTYDTFVYWLDKYLVDAIA